MTNIFIDILKIYWILAKSGDEMDLMGTCQDVKVLSGNASSSFSMSR